MRVCVDYFVVREDSFVLHQSCYGECVSADVHVLVALYRFIPEIVDRAEFLTVVLSDFLWVASLRRQIDPDPGSDKGASYHSYKRDRQQSGLVQKRINLAIMSQLSKARS